MFGVLCNEKQNLSFISKNKMSVSVGTVRNVGKDHQRIKMDTPKWKSDFLRNHAERLVQTITF